MTNRNGHPKGCPLFVIRQFYYYVPAVIANVEQDCSEFPNSNSAYCRLLSRFKIA